MMVLAQSIDELEQSMHIQDRLSKEHELSVDRHLSDWLELGSPKSLKVKVKEKKSQEKSVL